MSLQYPVSKETVHKYARDIFTPITRGESVTAIWVPMTGRRKHNKFVINNIDLFHEELPDYKNYILCYVDLLDLTEESKSGYIRLVGKSLIDACLRSKTEVKLKQISHAREEFNSETSSYSELLDVLKELLKEIVEQGFKIVLFLGEFDELEYVSPVFFGNLKSVWNSFYPDVNFVFLLRGRATRPENIKLWGEELSEVVLQNIVHVPLLGGRDRKYMFERLARELQVTFEPQEIETIENLCGGHPYMLKVAVQTLAVAKREGKPLDSEKLLTENQELISIATRIYRRQIEKDKIVLRDIAMKKSHRFVRGEESFEFLKEMGIIKEKTKSKYILFSEVLNDAIKRYERESQDNTENKLRLDATSKRLLLSDKPADDSFSQQEVAVLKSFLLSDEGFSSREHLGNVLWGNQVDKKFSNWAIDQLISKLRKKLRDLRVNVEIITLRGEGYKFYNA